MRSRQVYGLVRRRTERANRTRRRVAGRISRGLTGLGMVLALAGVALGLLVGLAYAELTRDLPPVEAVPVWMADLRPTRLLDRTGEHVLRTLAVPGVERRYLSLAEDGDPASTIDPADPLVRLTLAVYDPQFETHPGFLLHFPLDDQPHTLAERLAKDLLLDAEPTGIRRTLRTWILAAQLTARYGREQVLEWYLNSAAYGRLAYGAGSAAQTYFGKSAARLNLAEAAVLVAASQAPALNPLDAPEAARLNQKALLDELSGEGVISRSEYRSALEARLDFMEAQPEIEQEAWAFTNLALDQLEEQFGRARLERGGLDILTTLDAGLQHQAACALEAQVGRLTGEETQTSDQAACEAALLLPTQTDPATISADLKAGALMLDPQNGQILAMVGETSSKGEGPTLFSHPAGSLLTPFIYFTAFTRGMGPASLVWDVPLADADLAADDFSAYHGPLRMRQALVNDYLNPAGSLVDQFGVENIWKSAEPFGLDPLDLRIEPESGDYGRGPLSLMEAAQAYSVFAANGILAGQAAGPDADLHPTAVLKVVGPGGETLLDWTEPETSLVISPALAYLMNHVLSDETSRWPSLGHPNPLEIGRPVGAKLGSTPSGKDVWSVGYTPSRLAVVWMGLPADASPGQALKPGLAAGTWHALMQYATREMPVEGWEQPVGVSSLEVCDPSGLLPTGVCPAIVREIFLTGSEPTGPDTLYRAYQVNRETGLLATVFTPPELVDNRVFMVVPEEARSWAIAAGVDLPPDQYDSIQARSPSEDARLDTPQLFAVVHDEVVISGTAAGEDFSFFRVQVGEGLNPQSWIQVGPDNSSPVREAELARWDTGGLDGLYAVRLLVVREDQRVETATIQVTVDNTAPEVAIQYPTNGQALTAEENQVLAFQAGVSDTIGLERVEWYLNGARLAIQTQAPYSLPWKAQPGEHTLQVKAYDQAGNLASSPEVHFSVQK